MRVLITRFLRVGLQTAHPCQTLFILLGLLFPAFASAVTPMVAAGSYHTVALKSDGTVVAWGYNGYGELGNGNNTEYWSPVVVSGLSNVVAVSAGDWHTVALKTNGELWAWGLNYYGQLGDGTQNSHSSPVLVLTGVAAVAAGGNHTVALKANGEVWAWGDNTYGQLGDGSTAQRNSPVRVKGVGGVGYLSGMLAVTAGSTHTAAIKSDGTVVAWGDNQYGQLGDGTTTQRHSPVAVSGSAVVTAVAAGNGHTVALKQDSTVIAWGWNNIGQLGDGSLTNRSVPVQVKNILGNGNLTGVAAVSAGNLHTVALNSDGTVVAWGYNGYGELGDGTGMNSPLPVDTGLFNMAAVEAGNYHTVAYALNEEIATWGFNYYGGLGDGTDIHSYSPVWVLGFGGTPVPLTIPTSTLGYGVVGVYSGWTIVASGGVGAPYTWVYGSLPAGLSHNNGTIYGTPTAVGSTTFDVSVTDANLENVIKTFTIDVKYVDLRMTAVSTTSTSVRAGNSFTLSDTETNQGTSAMTVGSNTIKYYLSHDTTITTADTFVGQRTVSGALAVGANNSGSVTVTVPASLAAGTYYIGAIADGANVQPENNETNNWRAGAAITVQNVDLIPTAVSTASTSVAVGGSFTITDTVKNQGNIGGTYNNLVARRYLSIDATITSADIWIGDRMFNALAAGASSSGAATVTVPGNLAPGQYYIGVIEDDLINGQPESNETNNWKASATKINVVRNVDLVPTAVSTASASVAVGGSFTITDTVKNQGTTAGTYNNLVARRYLSIDATITSADIWIGDRMFNALAAGASSSGAATVTVPGNLAPGTYYIGVIEDSFNGQPESNETNNWKASATKITVH
jgi:alpha-tubulin suppressor-like RCC1 family protein